MSDSLNDKYIYYLFYKEKLKEEHGKDIHLIIEEMDNNIIRSIHLGFSILNSYSYKIRKDNNDGK